ncbi:MAG TPA: pyruvate dehydrogenase (acetyl-transferring) E1 component subunit alpha [Candidatus Thermoplasmatota archaeon]|nr:pyruvate dehydrogenase (acetyl-transferring) E1 component subunit alpha [Candidatus Thermoplasmatota archaeon]
MPPADLLTVIRADGSVAKAEPKVPDETLRRMYSTMVRTRMLDERGMNLQRQGRINFYIGSEGQEAIPAGTAAALAAEDWYFPHYRDLGVALYRGASIEGMVHQLYGSRKDPCLGHQMPNHFAYADLHFFSISSPLTTQVPQAVGAAYGMKLEKKRTVAATGFGDGSTSEGDFHVGLNFAAVWKCPVVFVCNNNQYAISVPVKLQMATETVAEKAAAYGIPGVRVDGNDVLAVYAAVHDAVERARRGEGPTLVEAVTFRMGPHSSSDDPKRYVPAELYEEWKAKDPIARFRAYLTRKGVWDDKRETQLAEDTKAEIQSAVEAAEKAGPPPIESLFSEVFHDTPPFLKRQLESLKESTGAENIAREGGDP